MGRRIVFFVFCMILWLALTWKVHYQSVLTGVVVSAISAMLFGLLFTEKAGHWVNPRRWLWLAYYAPVFLWYCLMANVDVAYRVIHPERPINPGIVKIKTTLKTDVAKAFLANSITLTPGTLSVDVDGEYLYIHWIDVRATDVKEASKAIAAKFERFLERIFE